MADSYTFPTIATTFPKVQGRSPAAELTNVYRQLQDAHATSASARLSTIDRPIKDLRFDVILSTVDVSRTLDEVEEQGSRWVRGFGLARNVFALAPLLLTWIALSLATTGYQAELGHDPATSHYITTPFLELWQQGFNHNLPVPWLTFSNTAFLDFVLIVIVVVL